MCPQGGSGFDLISAPSPALSGVGAAAGGWHLQALHVQWEEEQRLTRQILRLTNRAIASRIPFDGPERILDTSESRSVLRKAAQSAIVLLKNTNSLLPLDMPKGQTLAVIGSGARLASPSGGGSAQLACSYTTSPLDGITAAANELGIETRYAAGITAYRFCPLVTRFAKNLKIQFYVDDPTKGWLTDVESEITREPDFEVDAISTESHMADIIPYDDLGPSPRCRVSPIATYIPPPLPDTPATATVRLTRTS